MGTAEAKSKPTEAERGQAIAAAARLEGLAVEFDADPGTLEINRCTLGVSHPRKIVRELEVIWMGGPIVMVAAELQVEMIALYTLSLLPPCSCVGFDRERGLYYWQRLG